MFVAPSQVCGDCSQMRVLHPVTSKMLLRSESLRGVDIKGGEGTPGAAGGGG